MNESSEINIADKQHYCSEIYENFILRTMHFLDDCKSIADSYNNLLPAACFTNFRDALFHFRKLYYSTNRNDILEQGFAIKEHLNRACTDAIISLLNFFSDGIRLLLENGDISADEKSRLKFFLHRMQSISLFKRINGMMMFLYDVSRVSNEEIVDIMKEYSVYVKEHDLTQILADELEKISELGK